MSKVPILSFALVLTFVLSASGQMTARPGDEYLNPSSREAQKRPDQFNGAPQTDQYKQSVPSDTLISSEPGRGPGIDDLVKPTKSQKAPYLAFLKAENTGLFKVIPEENSGVIKVGDNRGFIPREGAYYSFARRRHDRTIADLKLVEGQFKIGLSDYAFVDSVDLGDVSLESVTSEIPSAAHLAALTPPLDVEAIETARKRSSLAVTAKLGQTYLLRSVIYNGYDILVAFRVVEIEQDGSMLILWKMLKKDKSPKIKM